MHFFSRQFRYIEEEALPVIRGIGQGCGGPHYDWDGSQRKEHLIVLQITLAGQGQVVTKQRTVDLPATNAFLAEIPGSFKYYGPASWQFLYVEFSPVIHQWLDSPFQLVKLSEAFCESIAKKIVEWNQRDMTLYENSQEAFQLMLDLKNELKQQRLRQSPQVLQIREYLEKHYARDLGLEDLAVHFQTSKFALIRQFQRVYQQTPMKYLQMYRINKSLQLLWSENEVQEVAKMVGFTSANYFGKVFKEQMGLSPTEYQKKRLLY